MFIFSLSVIFIFSILIQNAQAVTVSWDAGGDGTNWSDPLNWSSDILPSSSDDITIDANSGMNSVVHLNINFDLSGSLAINNADIFVIDSGKNLHNLGTIVNTGTIDINGTLSNDKNLNNGANGTINNKGLISNRGTINNSGNPPDQNAVINNYGTIHNAGILNNFDAYIYNKAGGTITNNNHGSPLPDSGTIHNFGNIENFGTIDNRIDSVLENNGIINNQCGGTFTGTGSFLGTPIADGCVSIYPIIHMQDTTSSFGLSVHSARPIQAEFVSPTSHLLGKKIDSISLKLKKVGSPTGMAEIGVFNSDLSVKKLFGTIDSASLSGIYPEYTFLLSSSKLYEIQSGDRIGIKFTGGNSLNNIGVMTDNKVSDPFDGQNTYHQFYTTKWIKFLNNDLTMTLTQTHP